MQINQEYDLCKLLASALKAKAPYIGIPMPGHAPLVLERDRLYRALKGVTPMNIEVEVSDGGRALLIEGQAGPRVRTRLRMFCVRNAYRKWDVQRAMHAWTESERRKRIAALACPTFTDRKAAAAFKKQAEFLRKLERELDKMGNPYQLQNPAVPSYIHRWGENSYYPDIFTKIKNGRRLRTVIGAIAAQAKREGWNNIRLYKELAHHGIEFEKLSDMTARQRELRGAVYFHDYLGKLYKFCHGTGCSYGDVYWSMVRGERQRSDGQQWGPERYMQKLADLQTRRGLQSQIDSVKAMMGRETKGPETAPAMASPGLAAEMAA